jgi:1,2-diacylglycerol 3-alpha-glucosyltransferase
VAIVYHFFPHYRGPIMQELIDHGRHEYVFYGSDQDPNDSGIEAWSVPDTVPFVVTPTVTFPRRIMIQGKLVRLALRKDIQTIVFLGNVKYPMTWISAALARLSGKRVLFWTHGWIRPEPGFSGWLRRTFYRLSHGLLLYGNLAREIGLSSGFAEANLYVIFNSLAYVQQKALREQVTEEDVRKLRRTLFPEPALPLVIGIGRQTYEKRFDLLLEATRQMACDGHRVNVLLVGEGPERPRLTRQAEEHGLSVVFWGPCYDEATLARLICAAEVTTVPGSIGLAAIHSLVYGVPVVTHNNARAQKPEWEAIVPGLNGTLYEESDVADLVKALSHWLQPDLDRDSVRHRCYAVVDRYYNPAFQREEIERAISGMPARLHHLNTRYGRLRHESAPS